MLIRIVIWILPVRLQLSSTKSFTNAAIQEIHLGSIVWAAMACGIDGPSVGASHVKNLLLCFTILDPPFNDLQTL